MTKLLSAFLLGALACACSDSKKESASASDVVINEINGAGTDEWIELYNKGDDDFELGAYALADTDKDTGVARTTKAMRFPYGTTLPPGEYVLVLLNKDPSTPGPYAADACLPGVSAGCFYALFSLSESRGEAVHLLSPDNTTLWSTTFPANLELGTDGSLTACRLPDGTGELTTCRATPAAQNLAQ